MKRRDANPLFSAFPLTVMSLTAFLVVFTLLMARLTAGADPALHPIATAALVERGSASRSATTRTSGGSSAAGVVPAQAVTTPASSNGQAIVTRVSGTAGSAKVGDE